MACPMFPDSYRIISPMFSAILSLSLLISSLGISRKVTSTKLLTLLHVIAAVSSLILLVTFLVSDYFTAEGINEAAIYHLRYGMEGAGFAEYRGLIIAAVLSVAVFLFAIFWWVLRQSDSLSAESRLHQPWARSMPLILVSSALLINPATTDLYHLLEKKPAQSSEFDLYYTKPYLLTQTGDGKNLVFIYAESLERTYFDESRFPGLITGLRELESHSIHFTNIGQVNGSGWTIAGMVSSQCGIPLFSPSDGNSMSGMDKFLPSATCLGDLLHKRGYHLTYYGGANIEFAGKQNFYLTHLFDEIRGRRELLPGIPDKSYQSGWGLFDDDLFNLAYHRFEELSETGKKFGLFMLTLDTHHPDGHPSKSCEAIRYHDGTNPILNAVACSDYLISAFVDRIQHSRFRDNTIIVIASDHLAMRNTAYHLLASGPRNNMFMIIDPADVQHTAINTPGSTLDIGTTILPFLGYKGQIGLGRDLIDASPQTVTDIRYIHNHLDTWQQAVIKLWAFPLLRDALEINTETHTVSLDGRPFKYPCLIEFNDQMETTIRFKFDMPAEEQNLSSLVQGLGSGQNYVLIDKCTNIGRPSYGQEYCMAAGKAGGAIETIPLNGNVRFTAAKLRSRLGMS
jgi:phosphoglycerol transferase